MIPDRLSGWWMASVVRDRRGAAALAAAGAATRCAPRASKLAAELADELDDALAGGASEERPGGRASRPSTTCSRCSARRRFARLGLGATDQALANVVELLEWCTSLIVDTRARARRPERRGAGRPRAARGRRSALCAPSPRCSSGGRAMPDLERLERLRRASTGRGSSSWRPRDRDFRAHAQISFHAHAIATSRAGDRRRGAGRRGRVDPRWLDAPRPLVRGRTAARGRPPRWRAAAYARLAFATRACARCGSSTACAARSRSRAAVAVADLISVQHGFWVVLGTLSVLRSNAASTGSTALRALAGTVIGFVIGGALLVAIGTDDDGAVGGAAVRRVRSPPTPRARRRSRSARRPSR